MRKAGYRLAAIASIIAVMAVWDSTDLYDCRSRYRSGHGGAFSRRNAGVSPVWRAVLVILGVGLASTGGSNRAQAEGKRTRPLESQAEGERADPHSVRSGKQKERRSMLHEFACADTGDAFGLWRQPFGGNDIVGLVHAAVLAANAHNSQPWRFTLSDGTIDVRADLARHLGSFDPSRREMHQSLGCAIENLAQAALAQGLEARVETFASALPPKSGDALAARMRFASIAARETELFGAIAKRHTNRGAYDDTRPLLTSLRDEMSALADHPDVRLILFDGVPRAELADLILEATRRIVADREMAADNAKWFRFTLRDVERRRDGLTLGANVPSPLVAAVGRLMTPSDRLANKSWIGSTKTQLKTAALLGLIAVPDAYERALALEVGRLWQRLHLLLTARGVAAQPLNQPIERAARERQLGLEPWATDALAHIIGDAGLQAAFVFRAGYAIRPACLSPRRRLEEVIRDDSAGWTRSIRP